MPVLTWLPIETAPDDGREVFVWNGGYRWASWRAPVFHPDPEHGDETWCIDRRPLSPPPTHWLPLLPPDDGAERPDDWTVMADCWRRGPGGSIACYTLAQRRPWVRCYEHHGGATLTDGMAETVAEALVRRLASEVFPRLFYAVRSAQGIDPDKRTRDHVPDA
jgi:hypothetical protein